MPRLLEGDLDAQRYVVDLAGVCRHAAGFGQIDRLTLAEEWALIEAALEARLSPPRA